MSPNNQGRKTIRGKTRIVKLKSHDNRKVRNSFNPHGHLIRAILRMFQKQLFRHKKEQGAWSQKGHAVRAVTGGWSLVTAVFMTQLTS